jgi:hypothetical protein
MWITMCILPGDAHADAQDWSTELNEQSARNRG